MLLHHTPLLGKTLAPSHELLFHLDPKLSSRVVLLLFSSYVIVVVVPASFSSFCFFFPAAMTCSLLFSSLLLTTSEDFNINFLILSITLSSYSSGWIFLSSPLCYTSSSLSMGRSNRPPMLNLLPLVALIFHSAVDFSYAVPSSFDNFASAGILLGLLPN
jgi:hypothetical protein